MSESDPQLPTLFEEEECESPFQNPTASQSALGHPTASQSASGHQTAPQPNPRYHLVAPTNDLVSQDPCPLTLGFRRQYAPEGSPTTSRTPTAYHRVIFPIRTFVPLCPWEYVDGTREFINEPGPIQPEVLPPLPSWSRLRALRWASTQDFCRRFTRSSD